MNATKITDAEIERASVAALPTRPTAPTAFGGSGYTSNELKRAFDRLPLLLAERYNTLLDDAASLGEESLSAAMPTGIMEEHTLSDLFEDLKNGSFTSYVTVGGETLYSVINRLLIAVFGEGIK